MAVVPESPPLKPGVTRMTVQTQTGSHTVRIANPPRDGGALHFLRYREPIVEEPEQEYRVAVPALPVLAGHDSLLGYLSPDGQRIAFVFGHEPVFYERTETDYLRKDLLGKMPPKRLVHPAGTHVWVAELRGGPPRFLGRIQEGPGATYSRHEIAWTRDGTALLLPLGEKDPRPQTRHRQRWWRIPVGG